MGIAGNLDDYSSRKAGEESRDSRPKSRKRSGEGSG